MNPATLRAAFILDWRLQWRYGFIYAAVFSIILWDVVVFLLPEGLKAPAMPYLIFGDLTIVGFFFIAGAVFFERGERTLFATLTTPMRFFDYLAAKLATLTLLSLLLSLVIVFSGVGFDFQAVSLILGTVLCAIILLLIGFISAAPFASISEWFIPSTVAIAVLNLPMAHYSGLWEPSFMYAFPTQGSLMLLGHAFDQVSLGAWEFGYAVGYQLLWIAILGWAAKATFNRFILQRRGGR